MKVGLRNKGGEGEGAAARQMVETMERTVTTEMSRTRLRIIWRGITVGRERGFGSQIGKGMYKRIYYRA